LKKALLMVVERGFFLCRCMVDMLSL